MPEVDFAAPGSRYLAQMWGARQIAIAGIIVISLVRGSSAMLLISLSAYCIMNIQDIMIGLSKQDYGLAGGAAFFFLLPAVMTVVLIRRSRRMQ